MKRIMLAVVIEGEGVDAGYAETNRIVRDITRQLVGPFGKLPEGVSSINVCPFNEVAQVLMVAGSPHGFKLENLAAHLADEVQAKSDKIIQTCEPTEINQRVISNNTQVRGLLLQILGLQLNTMTTLSELGPDQGPLGTARTDQQPAETAPPDRPVDYHNSYTGLDADGRAED